MQLSEWKKSRLISADSPYSILDESIRKMTDDLDAPLTENQIVLLDDQYALTRVELTAFMDPSEAESGMVNQAVSYVIQTLLSSMYRIVIFHEMGEVNSVMNEILRKMNVQQN